MQDCGNSSKLVLELELHQSLSLKYPSHQHIEAEIKWLPFSWRHFEMHFLEWKCMNSLTISLKCVRKVRINNIPSLVQIMAWRRPGDKPLSEPMMVSLVTHICITQPQWVKYCCIWNRGNHSDFSWVDDDVMPWKLFLHYRTFRGYPAKRALSLPCVSMAGRALLAGYPRFMGDPSLTGVLPRQREGNAELWCFFFFCS